jgi:hypothetical protein
VVTIPATPIHAADPGDPGPASQRQLCSRTAGHFADNLVTRNEPRANRRQIAFGNVQVGPANPTCKDAQQYIARLRLRMGDLLNLKIWFGRWSARNEDGSLHVRLLLAALGGEFLAQLVSVQRVLVRLFRQFMSRQMISLIMSGCSGAMRVGGKIMEFYEAIRRVR